MAGILKQIAKAALALHKVIRYLEDTSTGVGHDG